MPRRALARPLLQEDPTLDRLAQALTDPAQLDDLLTQADGHEWICSALDSAPETDPQRREIWRRLVQHPLLATTADEMGDSLIWRWILPPEDGTPPRDLAPEDVEALTRGALADPRPGPTGAPPAWLLVDIDACQPLLLADLGPASRATNIEGESLATVAIATQEERRDGALAAKRRDARTPAIAWHLPWADDATRAQILVTCWRAVATHTPATWLRVAEANLRELQQQPHQGAPAATPDERPLLLETALALMTRSWQAGTTIPATLLKSCLTAEDRGVREQALRLMSPPPTPTPPRGASRRHAATTTRATRGR